MFFNHKPVLTSEKVSIYNDFYNVMLFSDSKTNTIFYKGKSAVLCYI